MIRTCMILIASTLVLSNAVAAARFGEPLPEGEAQPVSRALAEATDEYGPLRKFSGRITEVCRNKGCWVMLESDGEVARVMMKDHGFAVPADARGDAVVYGRLQRRTLDEATARHLAEDAGGGGEAAREEYRIEAIGIELLDG